MKTRAHRGQHAQHVKLGYCCCFSTLACSCPSPTWFVYISQSPTGSLQRLQLHQPTTTEPRPYELPGLVFKAVTQILRSLTKTSSENSGVGGYLTGESNYNWHLNSRQTAGNLTLTTVHKLQVTVIVSKSFSPNRNRQVGEALTELCWPTTALKSWRTQTTWQQHLTVFIYCSADCVRGGVALDHNGIGIAVISPTNWHCETHCVV